MTRTKNRGRKRGANKGAAPDSLKSASDFSVLADQSLNISTDSIGSAPASASTPALPPTTKNLGKNRLAAGFARPALAHDPQPAVAALSVGESADSAIEISDDDEDMDDSEGGIVLNLQDQKAKDAVVLSDDDIESGEYSSPLTSPPATDTILPEDGTEHEIISEAVPTGSLKRLADLSNDQLEDQMTYAFYCLERDQFDLNRPVVCLQCLSEGHLSVDCEEKSESFLRLPKVKPGGQIKLWISCCACASKQHLVGDCPQADRARALRWSLASLDPDLIVNLSLESGTRRLEVDAENRGMRPAGLRIKGRAGRHTAGVSTRLDAESSEDDFLHGRRVGQQGRNTRYDRFDPPSGPRKGGPGRDGYYATDSFGRRRSRSPEAESFSRSRRSPSPRGGADRWQPPNRQYPPPHEMRSRDTRPSPAPLPRPNIQIRLPERRGSNPNSNQQSHSSSSNTKSHPTRPKKKKNQKT